MNECPDCGKSLVIRAKGCSCGWVKIEQKKPIIKDYQCQYGIENQRCPLPGTICPSPYSDSPWYCATHWHKQLFEGVKK
jgi:hypothetical protein